MGTYPWGPHGPQSGPNQVTPNPTPAYVPPPPTPSYDAPAAPSYGGGGGGGTSVPYTGTGTYTPRKKSYIFALLLTFFLGPLGLFYASKKGALIMLLMLFAAPVVMHARGVSPADLIDALGIWNNSTVMEQMWSVVAFLSIVWSVFAVADYNRSIKKRD